LAWTVEFSKTAVKQLKKIDKHEQKKIINFLKEKIENQSTPTLHGKSLKGDKSDLWRYRVGDYRIICQLENKELMVLVLTVGHRKNIYKL